MAAAWKPSVRKVCGVTRREDAQFAVRAGANAVGMVFYPPSPRSVRPREAKRVVDGIPPGIRRVGVFVSERAEVVAETVRAAGLNVAQLHGDETPEDCAAVRREAGDGIEVWKALPVGPGFDSRRLQSYSVDAFVLDTARAGFYGGTGETFPWHLALEAGRLARIVLAGGLDGDNVAKAARAAQPWGVDSSSRLEARPGVKDPERVARYLRAVL